MTESEKKLSPFDFIKSINNKQRIDLTKEYNKFLTNRAFSLHLDTIEIANEGNKLTHIDDDMHYDFMMAMIPRGNRYAKWPKPDKQNDAAYISRFLKVPMTTAYLYLNFYTSDEIKEIKEILDGTDK